MVHVAEDSRALAEDILSSARARQQGIADRKSGVAAFVKTNEVDRLRKFRDAHDCMSRRVAGLAATTRRFLSQCNDAQRGVAEALRRGAAELRQHLANSANARVEAFCQMHKRITGRVAGLARQVRCLLEESHNDSLATRVVWNDLASARSGVRKTTRKR